MRLVKMRPVGTTVLEHQIDESQSESECRSAQMQQVSGRTNTEPLLRMRCFEKRFSVGGLWSTLHP